MAAILESRSVARLREAKCGLPKKGWQTQCQMVGLSWLKFEFQCSTHSCSSIILSQFLSGHCDPYLIWLVSRPWGGRIQVVKLRRWLALGWGGVPGVFGGRCPMRWYATFIPHKKRGKTHSSTNRSHVGWRLSRQAQTLNPAKGVWVEDPRINGS